jgi:hypothetical protein
VWQGQLYLRRRREDTRPNMTLAPSLPFENSTGQNRALHYNNGPYSSIYLPGHFFYEGPSHHSLKAFCATPMKMMRMSSFFYQFLQLMEHQWNEIDRGNPTTRKKKPVPVPLCPPQISHGLDLGSNPGLRGETPATNRLSHGTAFPGHRQRGNWRKCSLLPPNEVVFVPSCISFPSCRIWLKIW